MTTKTGRSVRPSTTLRMSPTPMPVSINIARSSPTIRLDLTSSECNGSTIVKYPGLGCPDLEPALHERCGIELPCLITHFAHAPYAIPAFSRTEYTEGKDLRSGAILCYPFDSYGQLP